MARMSERLGRPDLAEKFYSDILAKEPYNQQVHHRLGVLAARSKRWRAAEKHFNQAKRLGKVSAALLNDIAYSDYLQNRPRSAEIKLRNALKLEPENLKSRSLLALVLGEQGRFQEGLSEFRRVVRGAESSTGPGDAYANLAPAAPNLKPQQSFQRTHSQLAAAGVPFRNVTAKKHVAIEANVHEAIAEKLSEPSLKSERKRRPRPMRWLRSRGELVIANKKRQQGKPRLERNVSAPVNSVKARSESTSNRKQIVNAKRSSGKGILSRGSRTPKSLSQSPTSKPTKRSPACAPRLSHVDKSADKTPRFSSAFPSRQASFHEPRDPQAACHVRPLNRPLFIRSSSWPHAWPLIRKTNK